MRRVLVVALSVALVAASAAAGGSASSKSRPPRIKRSSNSESLNWSSPAAYSKYTDLSAAGYAVTALTPFTDVRGSWVQPAANCSSTTGSPAQGPPGNGQAGVASGKSQDSYASFWVGLDGYSSDTVEQTGTDADCSGTTPVYYGWYEFYPASPHNLSNPVAPGDSMSAEVFDLNGTITATLTDDTQGWTSTATKSDKGDALSSAEWIVEAPSTGKKVLPLADFGTVTFTGANATNGSRSGSITAFPYHPLTMLTASGQVKAAPTTVVGTDGSSFTVDWFHS